jgi:Uma2 family endonuclease
MVQTPTSPENKTLLIELPKTIGLLVTQEQFAAIAAANRDLRLERTAQGELIVNPPMGWETGERNRSLTGQLDRWYEENEDLGKIKPLTPQLALFYPMVRLAPPTPLG